MNSAGGASASGPGPDPHGPGPSHSGSADELPPDLRETLRQVIAAGRASTGAFSDAGKAFRSLVTADISLARSAFGRSIAFVGLAVAFGASAWLLLMASVIVFLRTQAGLSWTVAMLACAGLSLAVTLLCAWYAARYFEHTRLKATRRQLARLGMGELADFTPAAGSAVSAKDAAENTSLEHADGEPMKDDRGIPVTPP